MRSFESRYRPHLLYKAAAVGMSTLLLLACRPASTPPIPTSPTPDNSSMTGVRFDKDSPLAAARLTLWYEREPAKKGEFYLVMLPKSLKPETPFEDQISEESFLFRVKITPENSSTTLTTVRLDSLPGKSIGWERTISGVDRSEGHFLRTRWEEGKFTSAIFDGREILYQTPQQPNSSRAALVLGGLQQSPNE